MGSAECVPFNQLISCHVMLCLYIYIYTHKNILLVRFASLWSIPCKSHTRIIFCKVSIYIHLWLIMIDLTTLELHNPNSPWHVPFGSTKNAKTRPGPQQKKYQRRCWTDPFCRFILLRLVVSRHPVLKNIRLRQLGWWSKANMNGKIKNWWQPVTTNQFSTNKPFTTSWSTMKSSMSFPSEKHTPQNT